MRADGQECPSGTLSKFNVPVVRPTGVDGPDTFQRDVVQCLKRLADERLLDNNVVKDVDIANSNTKVAHGLGRVPNGWEIIDTMGFGVVRRVSWDDKFVTFIASIPNTVTIRFH